MSSKIRIEFIRPRRNGDGGDLGAGAVFAMFGDALPITLTAASTASAAAPAFEADRGLMGGVFARITCERGVAIVNPTPAAAPVVTQVTGVRLEKGQPPMLIPIEPGQKIAAMEGAQGADGAIMPITSTALEGSRIFKEGPGDLKSVSIVSTNSSPTGDGFLVLMDALTVPANGAVTPLTTPLPVYAGQVSSFEWKTPVHFDVGLVGFFSTNANPLIKAEGTNAIFSAQVT